MGSLHKVAVSSDLTQVKDALSREGFAVVDLDDGLEGASAMVTSGRQQNFLGVQNRATEAAVIDATSMTADEVVAAVRRQTNLLH